MQIKELEDVSLVKASAEFISEHDLSICVREGI